MGMNTKYRGITLFYVKHLHRERVCRKQYNTTGHRQAFMLASISLETVGFEGQGLKIHCSKLNLESLRTYASMTVQMAVLYAKGKGNDQLQ